MIHNIVVVDGQEYKAVKDKDYCFNCAGLVSDRLCTRLEPCLEDVRTDKSSAVYKPHYKLKHK